MPSELSAFAEWIKAGQHLDFLQANAASNEIVIYGDGAPFTFRQRADEIGFGGRDRAAVDRQ